LITQTVTAQKVLEAKSKKLEWIPDKDSDGGGEYAWGAKSHSERMKSKKAILTWIFLFPSIQTENWREND